MVKIIRLFTMYCGAVLWLAGCSAPSADNDSMDVQNQVVPLSCIAVLPAGTSADKDETINYEKARNLEKGAEYATEVMQRLLLKNPKVRVLSEHQVATVVPDISGGITGTIATLGQKLNCDGVLSTTVRQYRQRQGTEYSVDSPAAVDFFMVLRHSSDGNILWSTDYREEQQSVLSNIFTFSKARARGFKWVTVEQLMEQGIEDRLEDCPYLQ